MRETFCTLLFRANVLRKGFKMYKMVRVKEETAKLLAMLVKETGKSKHDLVVEAVEMLKQAYGLDNANRNLKR